MPDEQPRWPRGTPWERRGPGPGRWMSSGGGWAARVAGSLPGALRGMLTGRAHLDVSPGSPARTAIEHLFNYDDPHGPGLTARVDSVSATGHMISITGEINTPVRPLGSYVVGHEGYVIGDYEMVLNRDGVVELSLIDIRDRRLQGEGFAKRWLMDHLFPQLAEHGFDKVVLIANIDVGGYAWARFGFDFSDQQDAHDMVGKLMAQVGRDGHVVIRDNHMGGGDTIVGDIGDETRAQLARLQQRVDDGLPISVLDIARIGRGNDDSFDGYPRHRANGPAIEMWLGKAFLMRSTWGGELEL